MTSRRARPIARLVAASIAIVVVLVVLVRGQTDGWVPYGFLLPERGPISLAAHVVGILALLMLAATVVWGRSRRRVRARPLARVPGS